MSPDWMWLNSSDANMDGTSREIPAGRRAKPREALAVMCRDVTYAGGA